MYINTGILLFKNNCELEAFRPSACTPTLEGQVTCQAWYAQLILCVGMQHN